MNELIEHKDKLGRLINVDDVVVFPIGNSLQFGKVKKLNNKMITVKPIKSNKRADKLKYPYDIVVITDPNISLILLK